MKKREFKKGDKVILLASKDPGNDHIDKLAGNFGIIEDVDHINKLYFVDFKGECLWLLKRYLFPVNNPKLNKLADHFNSELRILKHAVKTDHTFIENLEKQVIAQTKRVDSYAKPVTILEPEQIPDEKIKFGIQLDDNSYIKTELLDLEKLQKDFSERVKSNEYCAIVYKDDKGVHLTEPFYVPKTIRESFITTIEDIYKNTGEYVKTLIFKIEKDGKSI